MTTTATSHRGRLTLFALAAVAVGVVLVVVALLAQRSAPEPPRAAGSTDPSPSASASTAPSSAPTKADTGPVPLRASRPVHLSIPAIGVKTDVFRIGLAKDGTLAVPQPGPNEDKAAWFEKSPTPGQPGPSIIEGHVDSDRGPSVFFKLGKVRPGNKIHVTRADGVRATFTVSGVRDYKKSKFPTEVVYGAKNLGQPALRLITCSQFDPTIRHHVGNEVVFAQLTSVHR